MFEIYPVATSQNFDEDAYLLANPDVRAAVQKGVFKSGSSHFDVFGQNESRKLDRSNLPEFKQLTRKKKERIKPFLREDVPFIENDQYFDFLSQELRREFSIIETNAVSSNGYDADFMSVINENKAGLVLDCGAGSRQIYFDNVVNFEIAKYPSTDVLGVGEVLPFKDSTFDAVISNAVLEHVKDPWLCVSEILRVLKSGGEIICCVPFLQPLHGYPHHYYNMSAQGLRNIFGERVTVKRHYVPASTLPIWTLTWILNSWCEGLTKETKSEFLNMKVGDLIDNPVSYLTNKFVTELSEKKNFELASATVLRAYKKI